MGPRLMAGYSHGMPRGRKPAPSGVPRRDQVLNAAMELFSTTPYEDIAVDDVCSAAGVSHGLLSYHFGGKRRLFAAAVRQAWDEMIEWEKPRDDELTSTQRIRGYVHRHLEYAQRHPLRFATLMRTGHADEEVHAIVLDARRQAIQEIQNCLGCLGDPSAGLRAAIWGWVGYLDNVTLDWLRSPELSLDDASELCVQALVSAVRAGTGFRYDAETEMRALAHVVGDPVALADAEPVGRQAS